MNNSSILFRAATFLVLLSLMPGVFCFSSRSALASPAPDVFSRQYIRSEMERVFDWQGANPVRINNTGNSLWATAAFYVGIMAAYKGTKDKKYLDQAMKWSESRGWELGK